MSRAMPIRATYTLFNRCMPHNQSKNDTKKEAASVNNIQSNDDTKAASANNIEKETVDVFQSQQTPLNNIRDDHIDDHSAPDDPLNLKKRKNQPTAATVAVDNNFESDSGNNDGDHKIIDTNSNPAEDVISKKPKIGDKEG